MNNIFIKTERNLWYSVWSSCMNCGSRQLSYNDKTEILEQKCHDCGNVTKYKPQEGAALAEIKKLENKYKRAKKAASMKWGKVWKTEK